ncbi:MAG: putative LPS assembly protein LptD [Parafilimonas sp.]
MNSNNLNTFFKSLTANVDTTTPTKNLSAPDKIKTSDTLVTADTLNTLDTVDTLNTLDTVDTLNTLDTVDTLNTSNTFITHDTTGKIISDTIRNPLDSGRITSIDTLQFSGDSLDAPITYSAEDSGVLIIPEKQFILYGKAKADYKDMSLDAATINYSQQSQLIKAYGGTDTSAGSPLNKAKITQAGAETISDSISFNLKNQRGITKNTYYKEGEIFVNAETVKKVTTDVAYVYRARFTTCNLDTPHFDFRARKLKMINNKIAVSGPAFPEFEGVPMPIGIPFGIYPLNRGRHSGLLPPQYTSNESFGLGLEGLGFYKVLGEYWDVTVRSNIYSYGGWTLDVHPEYYKRYKYRGNLEFSYQHTKFLNQSGLSKQEFTVSNNFNITWSHAKDTKARPGTSFSANVHAGSTQYNQYVANNAFKNYQNQLTSSITYNKQWAEGKYNLTVSANHNQNNLLRLINLNLPTVTFSAATIYPFEKKEQIGSPKWYQKLGVSYNGTLENLIAFYDSAFSFQKLLDTAQWGAEHDIPISLSLPPLGPLIVSPGVSYAEKWYSQRTIREWNDADKKVDTITHKGFYAAREASFSLSMSTRIFGTVNFKKSKTIQAIRHEIKPTFSLNYKPDLVSQYYQTVQIDTFKNTYRFSQLEGVVGAFGEGRFGGMSFGIDNLFEMKVKDKKDTSGTKKIRLIDGLSLNTGYNLIADSFNWSPISISLRSTLFNNVNITGNASIDPYNVDTIGRRVNRLLWKDGKIGRLTNGSLSLSTSLKSKAKDERSDGERIPADETLTPEEQQQQLEYVRQNPAEFVDFNIPWTLSLSYSLSFYKTLAPDLKSFTTQVNSNVNINGDFSLTPKWKIGGGTYFDFSTHKLEAVSMFLTREMHCWQMAINIQIGQFKSFSITLNPKSGLLRDLRINKQFLQQ